MALFKIFKGPQNNLGTVASGTNAAHEGYAYFTTDNGKFYIDIVDAATAEIGVNRIPLSADRADKDDLGNIIKNTYAASLNLSGHTLKLIAKDGTSVLSTITLPDELVKQTVKTDNAEYKILTTSSASPTSGQAATVGYGANITYNPSTNKLSTGNIQLTGGLNVAGTATLSGETSADSLTAGNLQVNGSATFVNTINGNISGNAATATKLQTVRTINGTSFDGSANITTANWGTARNISISDSDGTNTGTGVSVNGSAAVTLKLPATIKATLTGNASSATKVTQNASNTTNTAYRILLSGTATDSAETTSLNKASNLQYNPSTNKLSTGNLQLTGTLNVSGQTVLSDNLDAQGITATDLLVNGAANFVQSPTAPTPADGDNSTKLATTAFVKGGFKPIQTTVDSGAATTNKWVSRIQQNANGVITVTMSSLDTSGTWSGKAAKLTDLTTADKGSSSDTWRYAWFSYNDNTTGRPAYDSSYAYQTSSQTLRAKHFLAQHTSGGGSEFTVTYGSTVNMSMMVGSGDINHGLYDHIAGKWMIYADGSGNVTVNGNAATAAKLATARTINGTSFDGSANITTANWGTARNISISDSNGTNTGAAVSVNGSAAVTLKLPSSLNLAGTLDVTGNTSLHNETIIDSATIGNMVVTGGTSFSQIPTAPTAAVGTNNTQLATTAFVMNAFTANDAMVFKGVVNSASGLPATHYQGWTYKVGTAGSYVGTYCEVGDLIICVTDGTSANNAHWAVIQNNVDGAVFMGHGGAAIGGATQPVYVKANGEVAAGTALKALAYKDSISYTPAGTISDTSITPAGTISSTSITPAGTNAKSAVTIKATTTDVYSMTSAGSVTAGTAASLSMSVVDEVLSFSWTTNTPTAVTLPGRSSVIKAWTGYTTGVDNTYAAAQVFTGTAASHNHTFTGTAASHNHTFTGTAATLS